MCAKVSEATKNTSWCASDGHTDITSLCTFFDTSEEFVSIDWDAVNANGWGAGFTKDSDLKRRKQAEFLVHSFFPWNLFVGIGVMDDATQKTVEKCLQQADHKPQIAVKRNWYY